MNFGYLLITLVVFKIFSDVVESRPLHLRGKKSSKGTNENVFTRAIRQKLFLQDLPDMNESERELQLPQFFKKLVDVDELVLKASEKYHDNKRISSALELLLELKAKQVQSLDENLQHTTNHLDRMIQALNLMIFTKWDDEQTQLEVVPLGSKYPTSRVNASKDGEVFTQLKKILSTGGFVFFILSTASEVCAVTRGISCIAVYLAGSCGVVLWLNSIYSIAFNTG